ncbi:MAG: putative toxin-antitoxin system toxin component, PIN family [Deinococcus sp.]|nr:putative toxin-antitoxin system toxin component, PIN family [Deinococcus sp.]
MIRIVLDANQYVSAVLNPKGLAAAILRASGLWGEVERVFELVVSPAILDEVQEVLGREHLRQLHGWSKGRVADFTSRLKDQAYLTPGRVVLTTTLKDPDDEVYLVAAVEAGASYLVTRDTELRSLKEYQGVLILDPAAFLALLRGEACRGLDWSRWCTLRLS